MSGAEEATEDSRLTKEAVGEVEAVEETEEGGRDTGESSWMMAVLVVVAVVVAALMIVVVEEVVLVIEALISSELRWTRSTR